MTLLSLVAAELSSMVEGTQQTLSSVWQLPPQNLIKGQALPPQWQQDSPLAVGTFCHPRWQVSLIVVEHLSTRSVGVFVLAVSWGPALLSPGSCVHCQCNIPHPHTADMHTSHVTTHSLLLNPTQTRVSCLHRNASHNPHRHAFHTPHFPHPTKARHSFQSDIPHRNAPHILCSKSMNCMNFRK